MVEPPPLTAKEILKTLKTLNSQLSLRINLYEYEKLPVHFKDYTIKSGRVTFHVAGEFELDLTIADEDRQAQFWFIDFRFSFTPRIAQIPEELLQHLENRVNLILSQDDPFNGCYKFLHELILTHKIAEIRRQAYNLNRSKWANTLVIEPLQRALCIQYWHGRYPIGKGPKSWIIIGVYSGKRKVGRPDIDATPRIGIRWFRDAKEVKNSNIPIDLDRISTEALLKTVIGMHVEHILTSTYDKLKEVPLYKNKELALESSMSPMEPIESVIQLQVTHNETLTIAIEPTTGRITLSPATHFNMRAGWDLNTKTTDPANDLCDLLMNFRPLLVQQEIVRKCVSTGWENASNPGIRMADLKGTVFRKSTQMVHWLKKPGWESHWYVAVGISPSGEEWKLVETSGLKRPPPGPTKGRPAWDVSTAKVSRESSMPMMVVSPIPSYAFFGTLHVFAAAQISHLIDVSTLHNAGVKYTMQDSMASVNSTSIKMPRVLVNLQGLVGFQGNGSLQQNQQSDPKKPLWAKDMISFTFSGVETMTKRKAVEEAPLSIKPESSSANGTPAANPPVTPFRTETPQPPSLEQVPQFDETCLVKTQASIVVPSCKDLDLLGKHVDDDIRFHAATGTFSIEVKTPFGQSSIPALSKRLRDIEQLVQFVKVMDLNKAGFKCQSVSLSKIVFSYRPDPVVADKSGVTSVEEDRNVDTNAAVYKASVNVGSLPDVLPTIRFEAGNPHVRMEDAFNNALHQYGLSTLLAALHVSLVLATTLNTIEKSWSELSEKATFFISIREVFICHLVYRIPGTAKGGRPKIVRIQTEFKTRRGQRKYMIKRIHEAGEDSSPDDVDEALKVIWNTVGNHADQPWKSLNGSAACDFPAVDALLFAIDEVIKTHVNQIGTSNTAAGKDKENKAVKEEKKEPQAPTPVMRGVGAPQPPQPPQRGIAPPALMTANSNSQMMQYLAQLPENERKIQVLRLQAQAAQNRARPQQQMQQRQQQGQAQRQGQDHEVITLDD